MGNSSYLFDDDNKTKYIYVYIYIYIYNLSIITKGMGKLKTHSPTYCIMDNWANMLNLTHAFDKLYLRHFISSMSSDKVCTMMIMRWCNGVQTNEYDLEGKTHPIIYSHHKLHNTNENKFLAFPGCIYNKWQWQWQWKSIYCQVRHMDSVHNQIYT